MIINYGPDLDNNNTMLNFVKIYPNRVAMEADINNSPNILVGSYVLIDYDYDSNGDNTITKEEFDNNFKIDSDNYIQNVDFTLTGYDSTVWQKRYNGTTKRFYYKMIAELNAIAFLGKKILNNQAVLTSNKNGWVSSTPGSAVGTEHWIKSSVDENGILSITHEVADIDDEDFSQNNNNVQIPLIKYDSKGHIISITDSSIELATADALTQEATTARAAEQANAKAIVKEEERAKKAESANAAAIAKEEERAQKAEAQIATDAQIALSAEAEKLTTAIENETSRATAAEVANATAIATEKARAEAAEAKALADAKEYVDDEDIFVTKILTVNALGGISAGANLDGYTTHEILRELLFPYVAQVVGTPTRTPSTIVLERGDDQIITAVSVKITKKSEDITKVELLKGSEVIATKEGVEVAAGGTITFSGLSVEVPSTNVVLTVKVTDAKDTVVSKDTAGWKFIYPYYYGICDKSAIINAELITGLTSDLTEKTEIKTYKYIPTTEQRAIIAYPSNYEELIKIEDENGFDNTNNFTKYTISIENKYNKIQEYYVYVSGVFAAENSFTFIYGG